MNYNQLAEMANQIEANGFSDVRDDAILKVAESSELLRKLNQEIKDKNIKSKSKKSAKKASRKKSGTQLIEGMFSFNKEASKSGSIGKKVLKTRIFKNKIIDGVAQTALVGLGISVAGRMIDNIEKGWDKRNFSRRKRGLINFARHENPALESVPDSRIGRYLDSAYAVSPRIANDPLSASAYINTAHAVGGVDLGTMKTLSDIQSKGGDGYTSNYDALHSVSGDILKQINP